MFSALEFASRNEPAIPSLPLPDRKTHHGLTRALRTEPAEGPLRLGFDAGGSLFQNHCRSLFYFITRTALCIAGFALMLSHHPPPDRRLPLTATHLRRCRRGPATYRVRAPQPRKQTNKRIAGWAGHLILTIRCGVQAGRVLDMKYRPLPLSRISGRRFQPKCGGVQKQAPPGRSQTASMCQVPEWSPGC